jgi:hypothetical protein
LFETLFLSNIWFILILWIIVYSSDYYLTLYCATLYHNHLKAYIVFEGSFELTPYFQQDVDSLRRVSPAFIRALILSLALIGLLWLLTIYLLPLPGLFSFAIGGLLLREAAVHLRHGRNLALMRLTRTGGGLTGKVIYARWLLLKLSALELWAFAGLFLLIALAWASWFFVGGGVFCLVTGVQHWRLVSKVGTVAVQQG